MDKEKLTLLMGSFPKAAEQRVAKGVSRKGYDSTGLGYQVIVNRMNTVVGVGNWGFEITEKTMVEGRTKGERPKTVFECDMEILVWIKDEAGEKCSLPSFGGHVGFTKWDAKKGALTSALKKGLAYFSCGWQTYAAALDEDAIYASDEYKELKTFETVEEVKNALVKTMPLEELAAEAIKLFKKDLKKLNKSELIELYNEVK
jgi:hypothetical protein